jgi:putative membrane protein insertion efficiency factor
MSPLARLFKGLIRVYQVTLSPFWGAQCRFHPSCSCYAVQAIEKHGAIKGFYLAIFRIMRCNPFSKGGIDLVPEKQSKK